MYAITGKQITLSLFVLLVSLIPVGINIVRSLNHLAHFPVLTYASMNRQRWCLPPLQTVPGATNRTRHLITLIIREYVWLNCLRRTAYSISSRKFEPTVDHRRLTNDAIVEIMTRTSSCLADTLVLCVTWYTTGSIHMFARRMQTEVSLTSLLLVDGAILFHQSCMVILNFRFGRDCLFLVGLIYHALTLQ